MNKSNHKTGPPAVILLIVVGTLIVLTGLLYACAPAPTPEPTSVPTPIPPTPTPLPDQSEYVAALDSSMHGFYDLGHGPNTWCARCHSPQNWDPEAIVGPEKGTCFTCKFPTDSELRIAEGNDLVLEEDWVGIPCETCHVVDDFGIASEEIAWLQPISGEYMEVKTATELCEKCHVTTTNNLFGSAVVHQVYFGSAHLDYAGFIGEEAPPTECVDCHDAHSLVAKQCVDCHEIDKTTHARGKYPSMEASVTCMACHDASPDWKLLTPSNLVYTVGPFGEGGLWVPVDATVGRSGEPANTPFVSHAIQGEVLCTRCHSEGNAYELVVLTAAGEPVEETTAP